MCDRGVREIDRKNKKRRVFKKCMPYLDVVEMRKKFDDFFCFTKNAAK